MVASVIRAWASNVTAPQQAAVNAPHSQAPVNDILDVEDSLLAQPRATKTPA